MVEYLPQVLWAYRTTRKSATQETPFALAFGTEVVDPVEVGLKPPRIELANIEHNEEALRLNLDLIEEKREQALKRVADYHRKTTRYYDQRVKPRSDSCHGRVSGINKICIRSSSYCRSQATAA